MQMTKYSDYSLRALIYLGLNRHRRCTIREIADAYGISENHLMKLVHQLGQEGFITTIRGKNGGLELAMPASEINLGEVFRATEGNCQLVECFAGREKNTCPIAGPCRLTGVLETALQAFLEVPGSVHARGHAEAGTGISAHLRGQRREQALIVTGGLGLHRTAAAGGLANDARHVAPVPAPPIAMGKKMGDYIE